MIAINKQVKYRKAAYTTRLKGEKGFSLVEVCVAMVVFAIIMVFMAKMYGVGTTYTVKQGDRRKATFLAKEALEGIIGQGFSQVETNYTIPSTVTNTLTGSGYTTFNRTIWLDYVDDNDFTSTTIGNTNAIRVATIVSSTKGTLGFQDVTLENVITNW